VTLCLAHTNPTSAISTSDTTLRYDSIALFAQGDYKFNDEWKVSGAVRYTDDRKTGFQTWRFEEFDNSLANNSLPGTSTAVNNANYGANTPAVDFTPVAVPGVAYAGAGVPYIDPASGNAVRQLAATWSAFTGEGGVNWTPDSSTLAYFKYSRGYKSGGFSTFTIAPNPETQAESVDAFEVGAKKSIGSTFTANIAAFYYDYTNDQIPLSVQQPSGLIAAQLFNLPLVVNYGVELEGIWKPIDPLQLSLQYSYLSAKVVNAPCFEDTVDPLALQPGAAAAAAKCTQASATAVVQSLKGDQLPQAAPNKISFNGLYTINFDPGKLVLSGTYIWKDKTYDSLFNRPYALSPAYSQVNLRATWIGANGRYNIIAFVDNVFNTLGYDGTTGSQLLPIVAGGPEAVVRNPSLTAPRTFGIEFQYRFQ
jgi:iron complex outermembrane receptor protein